MDGGTEEPEDFASVRPDRRRPDQDAAFSIEHELDQALVPGLCNQPLNVAGTLFRLTTTSSQASSAPASASPTEPISGSVKVARGSER